VLRRIVENALQSSDPAGDLLEESAEAVQGVLRHDWIGDTAGVGGTVAEKLRWEHGRAVAAQSEVSGASEAD